MSGGATWLTSRDEREVGAAEARVGEQLLVQGREGAEHVRGRSSTICLTAASTSKSTIVT